jgi:predicted kinase
MAKLYAMCGYAFSGKSTAARRIAAARGAAIVSLDTINAERGLDGAAGLPDAEWEATSAIALARIGALLHEGRSVVADDTHSHRFLRERARTCARDAGAGFVLVFVDVAAAACEARRAANAADPAPSRGGLAKDVFDAHVARFERPGDDEAPVRIADDAALAAWLDREE